MCSRLGCRPRGRADRGACGRQMIADRRSDGQCPCARPCAAVLMLAASCLRLCSYSICSHHLGDGRRILSGEWISGGGSLGPNGKRPKLLTVRVKRSLCAFSYSAHPQSKNKHGTRSTDVCADACALHFRCFLLFFVCFSPFFFSFFFRWLLTRHNFIGLVRIFSLREVCPHPSRNALHPSIAR